MRAWWRYRSGTRACRSEWRPCRHPGGGLKAHIGSVIPETTIALPALRWIEKLLALAGDQQTLRGADVVTIALPFRACTRCVRRNETGFVPRLRRASAPRWELSAISGRSLSRFRLTQRVHARKGSQSSPVAPRSVVLVPGESKIVFSIHRNAGSAIVVSGITEPICA